MYAALKVSIEGGHMQCGCGRKAIYFRRYSGEYLCRRCFAESIEKKFAHTIGRHNLIEKNEKVAVGISGGKDSSVLVHLLSRFREKFPFKMIGLTIDEGIMDYREKTQRKAEENCRTLRIEHHTFSFREELGFTLDEVSGELTHCSYCGVLRRYMLNKKARELGCTSLAVGHNLDDEAQSILMNMLRGDLGRMGRTGVTYKDISPGFVKRIKPMREIPEKEVKLFSMLENIDVDDSVCPYAGDAYRNDVRDFLNMMESRRPTTKHTILKSYDRLFPIFQQALIPETISQCEKCGEPSIGKMCKACEMREKIMAGL